MYEPSVTTVKELSAMESASHDISPLIGRLSHSQVLPQLLITLQKSKRGAGLGGAVHKKTTLYTAKATFLTVQISPSSSAGTSILDLDQQFCRFSNWGENRGGVNVHYITLDVVHLLCGLVVSPFPDFMTLCEEVPDLLLYPAAWCQGIKDLLPTL